MVVKPLNPSEITHEIKRNTIGYLMFLKMKTAGEIKSRGCADGRPQKVYMSNQEISSSAVKEESIFITSVVAAKDHRDISTADIPRVFL